MRIGMPIGKPHAPIGKDQSAGGPTPNPVDPLTGHAIEIAEMPESRRFAFDREGKATMTRVFMIKYTNDPIIAALFGPAPGEAFAGGLVVQRKEYLVQQAPTTGAVPILKLTVDYAEDEEDGVGRDRKSVV